VHDAFELHLWFGRLLSMVIYASIMWRPGTSAGAEIIILDRPPGAPSQVSLE